MNPNPTASDIRPIIGPVQYFTHHFIFWGSLWVVLLVIGCGLWFYWKYYHRQKQRVFTAQELANQELEKLENQIETLEPREFGNKVCDILRVYIVKDYGFQVDRQTSEEFISFIHRTQCFDAEKQKLLSEFLVQCDLLKFAKYEASLGAKREFISSARRFIQDAKPQVPQESAI